MDITPIEHGSDRYLDWVVLRQRILREPLGLRYSEADLEAEANQHHLVAISGGEIVGGLIFLPIGEAGPPDWKVRQVAVREDLRGTGLGRRLMHHVRGRAEHEGIRRIVLHAREEVVGFYEKLGYAVEGEGFEEVGIPHRRMVLDLSSA